MTLTSADGTVYGPQGSGDVAGYTLEDVFEVYEIVNPAPGEWQIDAVVVDVLPSQVKLGVSVMEVLPSSINSPPTALATFPTKNTVGEPVQFSGILSNDPDGQIVFYEWDFENDGDFDFASSQPDATHVYSAIYSGLAVLRVTDNLGAQAVSSFQVRIGDYVFVPLIGK
jgi:hypothetical protein